MFVFNKNTTLVCCFMGFEIGSYLKNVKRGGGTMTAINSKALLFGLFCCLKFEKIKATYCSCKCLSLDLDFQAYSSARRRWTSTTDWSWPSSWWSRSCSLVAFTSKTFRHGSRGWPTCLRCTSPTCWWYTWNSIRTLALSKCSLWSPVN